MTGVTQYPQIGLSIASAIDDGRDVVILEPARIDSRPALLAGTIALIEDPEPDPNRYIRAVILPHPFVSLAGHLPLPAYSHNGGIPGYAG